ncbi:MAG: hypothetical protein J07HQX50_00346 [Haloquadratum sp. J07HQX50]|jgi:hypothetical protein|nr:MAG: hypothetical protein J07HQX50_00346 [Haloquadratum sp. J07HQX50]
MERPESQHYPWQQLWEGGANTPAGAVVEAADEAAIEPGDVSEFESLTGKGVHADADGETYFVAKPALFTE